MFTVFIYDSVSAMDAAEDGRQQLTESRMDYGDTEQEEEGLES